MASGGWGFRGTGPPGHGASGAWRLEVQRGRAARQGARGPPPPAGRCGLLARRPQGRWSRRKANGAGVSASPILACRIGPVPEGAAPCRRSSRSGVRATVGRACPGDGIRFAAGLPRGDPEAPGAALPAAGGPVRRGLGVPCSRLWDARPVPSPAARRFLTGLAALPVGRPDRSPPWKRRLHRAVIRRGAPLARSSGVVPLASICGSRLRSIASGPGDTPVAGFVRGFSDPAGGCATVSSAWSSLWNYGVYSAIPLVCSALPIWGSCASALSRSSARGRAYPQAPGGAVDNPAIAVDNSCCSAMPRRIRLSLSGPAGPAA